MEIEPETKETGHVAEFDVQVFKHRLAWSLRLSLFIQMQLLFEKGNNVCQ